MRLFLAMLVLSLLSSCGVMIVEPVEEVYVPRRTILIQQPERQRIIVLPGL